MNFGRWSERERRARGNERERASEREGEGDRETETERQDVVIRTLKNIPNNQITFGSRDSGIELA